MEVLQPQELENKTLIVSHIQVTNPDRTPKDIANGLRAIEAAEAYQYPDRSELYDIYKRMELDGHLSGIWDKRISNVLNKKLEFVVDDKEVEELETLIGSAEFRDFIKLAMYEKSHGLSGAEFIPGKKFAWVEVPRKHIRPHKMVISTSQYGDAGISYKGLWNVMVMGNKHTLGFFARCMFYVLWKQGNYADWAQFIEIYGQPARIFKYDIFDDKTKQEALKLQKNAGASLAMAIPKQMEFEMQDGKTSNGNGELQDKFRLAMNDELSVIVLGNTETTTSSKSSGYAQANTHSKQQLQIIENDMKDMLNVLNSEQFLYILEQYGYPVQGGHFRYEAETDLEELKVKKDIDIAVSGKVPVGDDYWYQTYGIPKPDNYDELKAKMEADKAAAAVTQSLTKGNSKPGDQGEPVEPTPPGGDKNKKPAKPGEKKAPAKASRHGEPVEPSTFITHNWLNRLRTTLADFFDDAHK